MYLSAKQNLKIYFQGSLSRALGLSKPNSDTNEKVSPTSSSGSSSVISRVSPPLQRYRTSQSGGESPIYAVPFCHQDSSFTSKRKSDSGDYSITHSRQNLIKADIMDNIARNDKDRLLYGFMGNSLQRGKKQHRRVRSISDIDVNHIKKI